jgi:hypothetical protein
LATAYSVTIIDIGRKRMETKRRAVARRNIKRAAAAARRTQTLTRLPEKTRRALGKEATKTAARQRG